MYKTIHIKKHERGLWFRRGDLIDLLQPGAYRIPFWNLARDTVSVHDTTRTRFEHPALDVLLTSSVLRDQLHGVDLNDTQRALVWKDDRLAHILGPGRHAFWKTPYAIQIATFDVSEFRFAHPRLQAILQHPDAVKWLDGVFVDTHEDVLLYRDGALVEALRQGLHVFWKGTGKVSWKTIDRREETAAARSQANTAKLLAENPVLARLKEMEMLKEVLAGTKATFVFGQGDMGEQIRGLVSSQIEK